MPLKIEEIRKIQDRHEKLAAAEELRAYATDRAEEARQLRDQLIRECRADGEGAAEISRKGRVSPHTVKALLRGVPRSTPQADG